MLVAPAQKTSKVLCIQEPFIFDAIMVDFLDRTSRGAPLKRRKLTKAELHVAPNEKPFNVRYAELLRLRQAVKYALSEKERAQADGRRPNWRRTISDHWRL
jgi:hypothetical protein